MRHAVAGEPQHVERARLRPMPPPAQGSIGQFLWLLLPLLVACTDATTSRKLDAGGAPDSMSGAGDQIDVIHETADASASQATDSARNVDTSRDATAADARVTADAGAPPVSCDVTAPSACPTPAPTYADVAQIIKRRCESCHSPRWTGPWPLNSYENVADWQDTVRSNMLDCSMPPADSGITMPVEERLLVLGWLRCGLPQ